MTVTNTREVLPPSGGSPPVGPIGYTGSYREPATDIVEVSVVSVLEARGPV